MTPDDALRRAMSLVERLHAGDPALSPAEAVREIEELAARFAGIEPAATSLEMYAVMAAHVDLQHRRHIPGMEQLAQRAEELASRLSGDEMARANAILIATSHRVFVAHARGDRATVAALVERLAALADSLPTAHPQTHEMRRAIQEMLDGVGPLDRILDGAGVPSAAEIEVLRRAADRPGQTAADRAIALAILAAAERSAGERDPGGPYPDAAVRHFRDALETGGPSDPRRVTYLCGLADALLERRGPDGSLPGLDEAVATLEEARRLAGDPAHPVWTLVATMLAQSYRFRGDTERADRAGRDALRGNRWAVLLQGDAAAATAVARDAGRDAVHQARWLLGYGRTEEAIATLDLGRGLAIGAATWSGRAATRLRAAGHAELAASWAEVHDLRPAHVPPDLRREVVRALEGSVAGDPDITVADIRDALRRTGRDALIHLVAGDEHGEQGFAIVVPVDGEPSLLHLPKLALAPGGEVLTWIDATASREARTLRDMDAADVGGAPVTDLGWAAALRRVCAWAWDAAMQPLLEEHLPRRRRLARGRDPRLVLVPMSALGRVPWHAARSDGGSGSRYALESAVFSLAVSARAFRESSLVEELTVGRAGLVIGDQDTRGAAPQLEAALREALAIKQVFYPRGRYCGRMVDGSSVERRGGSPEEVLEWLADGGPRAGKVLHAACHGVVRSGSAAGDSSYLLLAGGERLSAERLLEWSGSDARRRLALVVLAACNSGVPGRGYDEALSLATTFLAAGANTVVSAQWAVPDAATSALMFMFHHYLHTGDRPAVDALRDAQLWALRRDPFVPKTMPEPILRSVRHAHRAAEAAWAGFVHLGR